jgi:murein DD-endopeptidase MepM/ murein hydrolase activator NlpD
LWIRPWGNDYNPYGDESASSRWIEIKPFAVNSDHCQVFHFPVEDTETNYYKFGEPYAGGKWEGVPHPGVDFDPAYGSDVYAIADGKVLRIGNDPGGYDDYVIIEHQLADEKIYSLYAHMSKIDVSKDNFVLAGETIGESGSGGNIDHLHFEIKRDTQMGLYPELDSETLYDHFYNPYDILEDHKFVPL